MGRPQPRKSPDPPPFCAVPAVSSSPRACSDVRNRLHRAPCHVQRRGARWALAAGDLHTAIVNAGAVRLDASLVYEVGEMAFRSLRIL